MIFFVVALTGCPTPSLQVLPVFALFSPSKMVDTSYEIIVISSDDESDIVSVASMKDSAFEDAYSQSSEDEDMDEDEVSCSMHNVLLFIETGRKLKRIY